MSSKSLLRVQAVSSNSFNLARKSNRRFLVFCAFLLTLLFGSSLLRASSSIPTLINSQVYKQAFYEGRRLIFSASGEVLQVRAIEHGLVNNIVQAGRPQHVYKRDEHLQCDRSHYRTDVCVARGDVRVAGGDGGRRGYEVLVLADSGHKRVERVKPYPRKWEDSIMSTIDEVKVIRKVINSANIVQESGPVRLNAGGYLQQIYKEKAANYTHLDHLKQQRLSPKIEKRRSSTTRRQQTELALQEKSRPANIPLIISKDHEKEELLPICEVQHEVPAILFSTGGYTGNVYHEFNDGLIPLFITAQQYKPAGQLVLIVLEYHSWWMSKYAEVVAQMTNHTILDLARDRRVHCFPEVTVGLRIHDELSINAHEDLHNASMAGFQAMLRAAYNYNRRPAWPAPQQLAPAATSKQGQRPKLVIISRRKSRVLVNEKQVVGVAREIGYEVQVLSPKPSTRMKELYRALSGCDVMMGVHGAAMTHVLFMRAGASTFIQVVPLGTDWAAETYYGQPARKLGLKYVQYKVSPRESSLWEHYASDDPVLLNPDSVNSKGWWETKRIYLDGQNVTVSLSSIRATLRSAFARTAAAAAATTPSPL